MHAYGFSTGALALGDFRSAIGLLNQYDAESIELSALRDHELPILMAALPSLDIKRYKYVSVHAPSRISTLSEAEVTDLLSPCLERRWRVIVHPDAIQDPANWDCFGELLCIENMDKRKPLGRTAQELERWFERFPEATFCLDLGHARQVDPSMTVAHEMVDRFRDRLRQIHLSELNSQSKHEPLSVATVEALKALKLRLPPVAVILESVVKRRQIGLELKMARAALDQPMRSQEDGADGSDQFLPWAALEGA